jgi:hypothetical protein
MTMNRRACRYLTIGAMLAFTSTGAMLAFTSTATAQSMFSGRTLEGAWNATLVFDQQGLPPCAPAGAVITAVSPGSGTVIAESCYASEGAGYGSWVRTARNRFAATFIGNSFGPDGTVAATYKVRAWVSLGPSEDAFSGPFTTDFFDLAGNLLGTVTGTVSAARIVVEP